MFAEFLAFLKEYKVVALAIGFIMGIASKDLVSSLVDNIIMPFISPLIPQATWRDAVLSMGPVHLKWGLFLSQVIEFTILAFVVFLIAKQILKEAKK